MRVLKNKKNRLDTNKPTVKNIFTKIFTAKHISEIIVVFIITAIDKFL